MKIILSDSDSAPIYEQITKQIRNSILTGKLKAGDPLPSIRQLAKNLKVSVITSKRAYEELERENLIVTRPGKGSFVNAHDKKMIQKKQTRMIEEKAGDLIEECRIYGVKREELLEIINRLFDSM